MSKRDTSLENDIARQASQIAERTHLRKIKNRFKARILVVDDLQTGYELAAGMLSLMGCTVDTAGGGLEALELLKKTPYDLVLMDVRMPDMDGREVTTRIRAMDGSPNQHVPVIALSADIFWQGDEQKCLQAGMNTCLRKPLRSDMLEAVLEHYLPEDKKA